LAREFSLAEEFSVVRPAKIEPHIAAFDPTSFLQHFAEGSDPVTSILILGRYRHEDTNATHFRFFGARKERPRRSDAAKEDNHIAPAHGVGSVNYVGSVNDQVSILQQCGGQLKADCIRGGAIDDCLKDRLLARIQPSLGYINPR